VIGGKRSGSWTTATNGKIVAIGKGGGGATGNNAIDCSTCIAMPGFITTHHHKYETPQRAANADGYIVFAADSDQQKNGWPYEAYSNLQGLWTQGRLTGVGGPPAPVIWELGKPTQEPDDLYNSHLVASLGELTFGITCSTDTSRASHTPEHTDAMIKGLMDSGQRGLFAYTGGVNRAGFGHATDPNGFEFPGVIGVHRLGHRSAEEQVLLLERSTGDVGFANRPHTSDECADRRAGRLHGVGSRQGIRCLDQPTQRCPT
jgi:hypothetical protein